MVSDVRKNYYKISMALEPNGTVSDRYFCPRGASITFLKLLIFNRLKESYTSLLPTFEFCVGKPFRKSSGGMKKYQIIIKS